MTERAHQRATIRRLRTGVVPEQEIDWLSVGCETIRDTVLDRLTVMGDGTIPPVFLRGEWGTGKSHLLALIRRTCRVLDVPSTGVTLNARTRPLNHPQRFLPGLCADLAVPNGRRGVHTLVAAELATDPGRERLAAFAAAGRGAFRDALSWLCRIASYEGPVAVLGNEAWRLLDGSDLSWSTHKAKREEALVRLSEVIALLRWLGFPGLVVALDELETIDQLWSVLSRRVAYDVLGSVMTISHACSVFAITERFARAIEHDIDNGLAERYELSPAAATFLQHWNAGAFEVLDTPGLEGDRALLLAGRVASLYGAAYAVELPPEERLQDWVTRWRRGTGRNPRILIRQIVNALDCARALEVVG